mgnify:CR=1 FL=1|tara:strand:- start:384 stop:1403 length:1020 start_codon:yes stop_codon:yes gene_type:complete
MIPKIIEKHDYQRLSVNDKLEFFKPNYTQKQKTFADDISFSLNQNTKKINPKYLYDEYGSKLFEEICSLSEYYPFECEKSILKIIGKKLIPHIDSTIRIVELGSGSSSKTRLLINALKSKMEIEYFPIDISEILIDSVKKLYDDYGELRITGIIDTYESGLNFIRHLDDKPNLITFLGSSFGNFNEYEGRKFLKEIHDLMKIQDLFLIGLDLTKNPKILYNAYNDSKGITAKFNLNILNRINRELEANFDTSNFEHYAFYNEEESRIEMHLRSMSNQTVQILKANLSIELIKDELIHTENSYKFSVSQIKSMLEDSDFDISEIWFDPRQYYALVLAKRH